MSRKFYYILGVAAFLVLSFTAQAQQDPYYTHFKFNKQAYNPAAVGEKNDLICINGLMHNHWLGFDDHTFIDRKDGSLPQGTEPLENVAGQTYSFTIGGQITSNKGKKTWGAIGANILSDQVGFMKTTMFKAQAAYFIPIQGNFGRLSLGLEAGMGQFGFEDPNFRALDAGDPRVPLIGSNDSKLDLGFGVYYKQRRLGNAVQDFYAGLSATHLTQSTYNVPVNNSGGGTTVDYIYELHYYFVTGGNIDLPNPAMVLEPSVLVKVKAKPQFDLNCTLLYNDQIRGGIGYRQWGNIDAVSALVGYKVDLKKAGTMQIGYAYDITLSRIQQVSNGSHEVVFQYCFPLVVQTDKPQHFHRNTRWL